MAIEDDKGETRCVTAAPQRATSDDQASQPLDVVEPVVQPMRVCPRATVLIVILNHVAYVRGLLQSIISQWDPNLELLVVDNGSTDGSFNAVLDVLADAPNVAASMLRVAAPHGMGDLAQIIQRANAPIIIQADSDDVMMHGRFNAILECFDADPRCLLVTSNAVVLSERGMPVGLHDTSLDDQIVGDPLHAASQAGSATWLGATIAYHRSLIEGFPQIDQDLCPYGIDLLLPFRAALRGTHHYLAEPYVGWRQHDRNTHKLVGANSQQDEALERHGAFELMVLAQKIRDLEYVAPAHDEAFCFDLVAAASRQTFFESFERWSRARNRFSRAGQRVAVGQTSAAFVAIPPVTVLQEGVRRYFGRGDTLGITAQSWDGFYPPEDAWNWTSRIAVMTFAVRGDAADLMMLGVRCPGFPSRRFLRLSVNLGPFVEVSVSEETTIAEIPIKEPQSSVVSVVVHAMGAAKPHNDDDRLLGVQLLFIEVRRRTLDS